MFQPNAKIFLSRAEIDEDCAERRLFQAIICRAIDDALGVTVTYFKNGGGEPIKQGARAWFRDAGAEFCMIATAAGYEPSALRSAALEYIAANDGKANRGLSPKSRALPCKS